MRHLGITATLLGLIPGVALGQSADRIEGNGDVRVAAELLGFGYEEVESICNDAGNADEVLITLTVGDLNISISDTIYAWWAGDEDSTCVGKEIPASTDEKNFIESRKLSSSDGVEVPGAVTFPSDFDIPFTEAKVLEHATVCEDFPNNLADAMYKLCLGIDRPSGVAEGDRTITEVSEFWGSVVFEIDTDAPPAPAITKVTPRDQALKIDASITDTSVEDISTWVAITRPYPLADDGDPPGENEEPPPTNSDCTRWEDAKRTEITANERRASVVALGLDNGIWYELCILVKDDAGNESPPSTNAVGKPQDECDFHECYPGGLRTGYCGAAPPSLSIVMGLLLFRRRRRS